MYKAHYQPKADIAAIHNSHWNANSQEDWDRWQIELLYCHKAKMKNPEDIARAQRTIEILVSRVSNCDTFEELYEHESDDRSV